MKSDHIILNTANTRLSCREAGVCLSEETGTEQSNKAKKAVDLFGEILYNNIILKKHRE